MWIFTDWVVISTATHGKTIFEQEKPLLTILFCIGHLVAAPSRGGGAITKELGRLPSSVVNSSPLLSPKSNILHSMKACDKNI